MTDIGYRPQHEKSLTAKALQAVAKTRFGGWLFINVFPIIDRAVIPLSRGRLKVAMGQPILLLHTCGARSRQPRTTPLLYTPTITASWSSPPRPAPRTTPIGFTTSAPIPTMSRSRSVAHGSRSDRASWRGLNVPTCGGGSTTTTTAMPPTRHVLATASSRSSSSSEHHRIGPTLSRRRTVLAPVPEESASQTPLEELRGVVLRRIENRTVCRARVGVQRDRVADSRQRRRQLLRERREDGRVREALGQ